MFTRRLRPFAASAAAIATSMLFAASAHAGDSIAIVAAYDYDSPTYVGNTFFEIVNNTSSTLTNISFTAVGDGAAGASDTALWTWANIAVSSGSSTKLYFGDSSTTVTGTGYGFTTDYQLLLAGNDQTYTFSGTSNGTTYTLTFSPTVNATGAFVAFLGNDSNGDSLPSAVSATVASVAVSAVPEPATWMLALGGVFALTSLRRVRQA